MPIFPHLATLTTTELIHSFRKRRPRPRPTSWYSSLIHDEIAFELVSRGSEGVELLLAEVDPGDVMRYRSILGALPSAEDAKTMGLHRARIERLLLDAVQDHRHPVVWHALRGLSLLGVAIPKRDAMALASDPDPILAAGALDYICGVYPESAGPLLRSALGSRHAVLREAAVDEIEDRCIPGFVEEIRRLAGDRSSRVREAATGAMENLIDGPGVQ